MKPADPEGPASSSAPYSPSSDETPSASSEDGVSPRGRGPFPALAERNYQLLLFGNGLSHAGDQMEFVARGWLVFELTDSPLALGVLAVAQGIPRLLLSLVAGVMADRMDRRKLLLACNVANLLVAALFAFLVWIEAIAYWHVLLLALCSSVFSTANMVVRQTMIPDIVSRANLSNAIALHQSVRGTTQIIAQSLAGVLIALIGVAGVLFVNAASYLFLLGALVLMRLPPATIPTVRLGFRQDLGRGFQFVWTRKDLFYLMVLALVPFVLIQPYRQMLPVFARDVWNAGPEGYGLLMAAPGLGALVSAMALAWLNPHRRGLISLISLVALSASMVAFALSPTFEPALVLVVLVGVCFNVFRITNSTAIQLLTPSEMMGRVVGIYSTDRGFIPLGGLLVGAAATLVGVPIAVAAGAGVCGMLAVAFAVIRPSLRSV